MQLSGKLISILPEVTGEGRNGPWKKREFIIETNDSFPKKICISNWNDRIDLVQELLYKQVTLDVSVESREYNGRWYTDLRAQSMITEKPVPAGGGEEVEFDPISGVQSEEEQNLSGNPNPHSQDQDDLPF
jgi:hypothetical protein